MRNSIYIIVIILLILWVVGAFIYTIGKIAHMLLVLALILLLIRAVKGSRRA